MSTLETASKPVSTPAAAVQEETPSSTDPNRLGERLIRILIPVAMLGALILLWAWYVTAYDVPHYILPSPSRVAKAMIEDWHILGPALLVTLKITFTALALALIGGVALAVLLIQSKWIELALYPYAVILQVTPIVAIAPLILIYAPTTQSALLICAWLVAFFPILANTTLGLKSADHNLVDLYRLYGASRWQTLRHLRLPSAMPFFLGGLRIAGGLSLIGAIVAEFAAGTAGAGSGLAFRILEAGYRLNIPRLFAALILISITGILIFLSFSALSHLLLRRWHESALKPER